VSGYIAPEDEPQNLDQTDLIQGLRCEVEVGCKLSREGGEASRWAQAGRPVPLVSHRAPASFWCLLESSTSF
jgi:hypothetical protein